MCPRKEAGSMNGTQTDLEEEPQIDWWLDHYEPPPPPSPFKPRSVIGSMDSRGPIGEPSRLESDGATPVRLHQGLSTISVSSFLMKEDVPATFVALKREHLAGYMVTLSCVLTNMEYGILIDSLERSAGIVGESVSVGVKFEPTTPNLVQPTTAPSTS